MAKSTRKAGGNKAKVAKKRAPLAARVLWKKQIEGEKRVTGARAGAKKKAAPPKTSGVARQKVAARQAARPAPGSEAASAAVRGLAKPPAAEAQPTATPPPL